MAGPQIDSPVIAVGLPADEIERIAAGVGAPAVAVGAETAAGLLGSARVDLVALDISLAADVLSAGLARPMPVGLAPSVLVLYPPERAAEAEGLARRHGVHPLVRTGDYLAWLPQFAAQACSAHRAAREAARELAAQVAELKSGKHRLDSAVECMAEGLVVLDRDYRTAALNPAARELLGVTSLEELAAKLGAGEIDPGLHPVFWLEAHGEEAKPVRCWEAQGCERAACPAHGSGLFPCWLYNGTLCHGGSPASFPGKLARCYGCEVYRRSAELDDPARALGRREVQTEGSPGRILESLSSPIVDDAGQFRGVVKILRDVTAERKLQEVRQQFVSLITHELRTPLTSISGFLWLVLAGHAGELNDVQHRQLTIAHRQTKRLEALVTNLLDLSALEAGRFHLSRQEFDLLPLLVETAELLRPQSEAAKVPVRVAPSDGPVTVEADRPRVAQVVTNLVANAIKYSPADTEVVLAARPHEGGALVEVADRGQGIPPDDIPHLFDRHYRVESSAATVRGTGLGLAISKALVEAHGGRIGVESAEGHGSQFFFTLPPPGEGDAARC